MVVFINLRRNAEQLDRLDGGQMCTSQYKFMFNSCRVPLSRKDTTIHYKYRQGDVAVLHRGKIWLIHALGGNAVANAEDIQKYHL